METRCNNHLPTFICCSKSRRGSVDVKAFFDNLIIMNVKRTNYVAVLKTHTLRVFFHLIHEQFPLRTIIWLEMIHILFIFPSRFISKKIKKWLKQMKLSLLLQQQPKQSQSQSQSKKPHQKSPQKMDMEKRHKQMATEHQRKSLRKKKRKKIHQKRCVQSCWLGSVATRASRFWRNQNQPLKLEKFWFVFVHGESLKFFLISIMFTARIVVA